MITMTTKHARRPIASQRRRVWRHQSTYHRSTTHQHKQLTKLTRLSRQNWPTARRTRLPCLRTTRRLAARCQQKHSRKLPKRRWRWRRRLVHRHRQRASRVASLLLLEIHHHRRSHRQRKVRWMSGIQMLLRNFSGKRACGHWIGFVGDSQTLLQSVRWVRIPSGAGRLRPLAGLEAIHCDWCVEQVEEHDTTRTAAGGSRCRRRGRRWWGGILPTEQVNITASILLRLLFGSVHCCRCGERKWR